MTKKILTDVQNAVAEYQCSGCIFGPMLTCFEPAKYGVGCIKHGAGTIIQPCIGRIYLGMPKAFTRLGVFKEMRPEIYESIEHKDNQYGTYDKFNVPCWKYKNKDGHIFVRGLKPRLNEPFLHVILAGDISKIGCYEVSEEDMEGMD